MNRKLSLLAAIGCIPMFMGATYANHPHPQKMIQFYAGLAGGIDKLSGNRSESTNEDLGGGVRNIITYSSNKSLAEKNAAVSLVAGFMWKPCQLPILLGPELFFGRGNTNSVVTDDRFSAAFAATRHYSTAFQRKFYYGALLRAGLQFCRDYLAYLSLGVERGQFARTSIFTSAPVSPNDLLATTIKNTKWLNGFVFGIGLEKKIDSFVVGLDLRAVRYRKYQSVDTVPPPPGTGLLPGTLAFNAQPKIYSGMLRICYQF